MARLCDIGLAAITRPSSSTGAVDGSMDVEPLLFFGAFAVLAGGVIWASNRQRAERQRFMTPAERSYDDYLQAMANRPAYYGGWGVGPGWGAPAPLFQVQL